MTTKKKPVPLRDQIIRFLLAKEEATAKHIAAATTERDFPSRVTAELNKLRTDAIVECEKKKGKNELWYWLAAKTSGDSQPAVEQNTGSSAADDSNAPPAAGAAVQPEPAPEAAAPLSADPVAVDEIPQPQYDPRSVSFSAAARAEAAQDENYSLLGVLADIRAAVGDGEGKIMLGELGEHIRGRITLLEAEAGALRKEISKADRELDKIRDALLPHVFFGLDDDAPGAVFCAKRAAELLQRTLEANREHLNMIAVASETLAPLVRGDIDASDMELHELAENVAAQLAGKDADLADRTASMHNACLALGVVGAHLGTDPDEGGPGPILEAIDRKDGKIAELQHKVSMQDAELFKRDALIKDLRTEINVADVNLGNAHKEIAHLNAKLMSIDETCDRVEQSLFYGATGDTAFRVREMMDFALQAIDAYRSEAKELDAKITNQTALVDKLEHLLQSARNEAEHLRRHADAAGADMVNHPPHYQGKVECIDAIEAALGADGFAAYCRGNAIKYSFRAGRKGPAGEDLAKARWYLERVAA
jgi:predicted  nucleic acid-binding Zn-ribbon protein